MNEHQYSESFAAPDFKEAIVVASQGQRCGTFLLDIVFYFIFCFVLGVVLGITGLGNVTKNMNSTLFGFVTLYMYYASQEPFSGRTLGKRIAGTKAVNEDGSEMSFNQGLLRTLCRFIPFDAFSFLGGNGRPMGWHDKISKTKVISVRRK